MSPMFTCVSLTPCGRQEFNDYLVKNGKPGSVTIEFKPERHRRYNSPRGTCHGRPLPLDINGGGSTYGAFNVLC